MGKNLTIYMGLFLCTFYNIWPNTSPILSDVFNESMSTSVFLSYMKLAVITPIYKGGSKLDVSNYFPVSFLSSLSKVLEEIVQFRLIKFLNLNKHKLINSKQYVFQEKKSTTLAVFDLYSKIIKALGNSDYAYSVFLDFAEAFDTVNYEILIKKLENHGIRWILSKWFIS